MAKSESTHKAATLTSLPPELHLEISKHLGPEPGICFGLTCKAFYAIHKEVHGKVKLPGYHTWTGVGRKNSSKFWRKKGRTHGCYLYELLANWASPLMFCFAKEKFVEAEEGKKRCGAVEYGRSMGIRKCRCDTVWHRRRKAWVVLRDSSTLLDAVIEWGPLDGELQATLAS